MKGSKGNAPPPTSTRWSERNPAVEDALLREIVRGAPVSVWAARGPEGQYSIEVWSEGAARIYGFPREKAIGENYLSLFVSGAERPQAVIDHPRITEGGEIFRNFLAEDVSADGEPRVMLTQCFRVWDPELGEYLLSEIGVDISGLDESAEHLRRIRENGLRVRAAESHARVLDMLHRQAAEMVSASRQVAGVDAVAASVISGVRSVCTTLAAAELWLWRNGQWAVDSRRVGPPILNLSDVAPGKRFTLLRSSRLYEKGEWSSRGRRLKHQLPNPSNTSGAVRVYPLGKVADADAPVGGVLVLETPEPLDAGTVQALELFVTQANGALSVAQLIDRLRRSADIITEHKVEEARSRLVRDYVHRIGNAATPLIVTLERVRKRLPARALQAVEKDLDRAIASASVLERAVREIQIEPVPESFDCVQLVRGIVNTLKFEHPTTTFIYSPTGTAAVRGRMKLLESAIVCVISNGVEAMDALPEAQRKLTVGVSVQSGRVDISVRDRGIGIPRDLRKKIWMPGFTTKEGLHGYGLARAREVIQDHGGSIKLLTSRKNRGTTVEISIPLDEEEHDGAQ